MQIEIPDNYIADAIDKHVKNTIDRMVADLMSRHNFSGDSAYALIQSRVKAKVREKVDEVTERMFADMATIEKAVHEAMVKKAQAKLTKLMKELDASVNRPVHQGTVPLATFSEQCDGYVIK